MTSSGLKTINFKIMTELNKKIELETSTDTAIAVEPVLATGFSFGDKVQYLMNYNGIKQWWDGFVIEEKPELRLMVKFLDNFKYEVTVRKEQMQYLRKAGC